METKTKILIGVGIGVATLLTVGIIGYKKGWFKKAGVLSGETGSTGAVPEKTPEELAAYIKVKKEAPEYKKALLVPTLQRTREQNILISNSNRG